MTISLRLLTNADYGFLYELLKERDATINISHKEMPSYQDHCNFWDSNPYRVAYMVYERFNRGYIYLTRHGEVGLFISKLYQSQGLGQIALKLLFVKHKGQKILANINPQNAKSINFFTKFGFKHIQNTYEIINSG